jgi:peptide deformylase
VLDMFASMEAADGVGLAANQIGVDARIFVIDCPDAAGEDVVGFVVNPELTILEPHEGEPAEEVIEEGCLSVPGPYTELPRAFRARVDGVDAQGEPVSIEATGMAARCLQHEVDHLNGTVYVDLLPEELRGRLLAEAAGPRGELPA